MTENITMLLQGMWETLYMTIASVVFSYLLGLPLGCAVCFDFCTWNCSPQKNAHRFGLDH